MTKVTIVDYGSGNVASVASAFRSVGADVALTSTVDEIRTAQRLVLPGVGAFSECRRLLEERDMFGVIKTFIKSDRPFLGICVGMQLLFDGSDEFGSTAGWGIIAGRASHIPTINVEGKTLKAPHIGWSPIKISSAPNEPLFDGVCDGAHVYFVHSFAGVPTTQDTSIGWTTYGGHAICAAVRSGNAYGLQFHPEKSGPIGLRMVSNFATQPVR